MSYPQYAQRTLHKIENTSNARGPSSRVKEQASGDFKQNWKWFQRHLPGWLPSCDTKLMMPLELLAWWNADMYVMNWCTTTQTFTLKYLSNLQLPLGYCFACIFANWSIYALKVRGAWVAFLSLVGKSASVLQSSCCTSLFNDVVSQTKWVEKISCCW